MKCFCVYMIHMAYVMPSINKVEEKPWPISSGQILYREISEWRWTIRKYTWASTPGLFLYIGGSSLGRCHAALNLLLSFCMYREVIALMEAGIIQRYNETSLRTVDRNTLQRRIVLGPRGGAILLNERLRDIPFPANQSKVDSSGQTWRYQNR